MPGPGEYRPDPTEGTTRVVDLPKPKFASGAETIAGGPARAAAIAPTATAWPAAPSTTSATPSPAGPATSSCSTPSTTAPAAASTSTPT